MAFIVFAPKTKGGSPMRVLLASIGFVAIALPAIAANVDPSTCSAKRWMDAFNKGDTAAVVALYAPDAIEVMTNGVRVGPALVKERVEGDIKQGLKYKDITTTKCDIYSEIRISAGDWNAEVPQQGPIGGFSHWQRHTATTTSQING